ncbi:hypothetical protein BVC80_1061g3 [Macleaya cordata]|uniref:Uncharacterized protein n=1 Tax=Macleaya cordata TaxID=56857 RepID=A0A200RCP9_MACCD|nr:hypothetical protein BVC80_1061g3 [Macleaya cordata]
METELENMENLRTFNLENENNSGSGWIGGGEGDVGNLKYTSLKDIIPNSPTTAMCVINEGNCFFDSSSISIRNQLVKHAASAYLQSAMILGSPNQSWVGRVWRKFVGHMVHQIGGVWGGRPPIS